MNNRRLSSRPMRHIWRTVKEPLIVNNDGSPVNALVERVDDAGWPIRDAAAPEEDS